MISYWNTAEMLAKPKREPFFDPKDSWGYFYIFIWTYKFYLRQVLVGMVTPWIIGFLSFVELTGPLTHLVPIFHDEPSSRVLTGLLLIAAGALLLHHHRLKDRVERLKLLVGSLVVLLDFNSEQGLTKPMGDEKRRARISDVLYTFVFALQNRQSSGGFAATLVVREGKKFKVYAQDYNGAFDPSITLDHELSSAGQISGEDINTLLYVPDTTHRHGAKILVNGDGHGQGMARKSEILPNAFQPWEGDPECLRSLLCARVPVPGKPEDRTAVICISSNKKDAMGDLEFHAIKLAAGYIGMLL